MPRKKQAHILELHCPELDVTVDCFKITSSETYQDALIHMQAVFRGEPEKVWSHDVNGEPVSNLIPLQMASISW